MAECFNILTADPDHMDDQQHKEAEEDDQSDDWKYLNISNSLQSFCYDLHDMG